jgi:hypothetical protein
LFYVFYFECVPDPVAAVLALPCCCCRRHHSPQNVSFAAKNPKSLSPATDDQIQNLPLPGRTTSQVSRPPHLLPPLRRRQQVRQVRGGREDHLLQRRFERRPVGPLSGPLRADQGEFFYEHLKNIKLVFNSFNYCKLQNLLQNRRKLFYSLLL